MFHFTTLSMREQGILRLLGTGMTSKEIAVALDISVATVSEHRKHICLKLGVHSTAELISQAVRYTLLTPIT